MVCIRRALCVSPLIKIPLSDQPFRQICPPQNLFSLSISLAACINSLLTAPLLIWRLGGCLAMVLLLSRTVRGASSSFSSGLAPPSPPLPRDWRQQDTDIISASTKRYLAIPRGSPTRFLHLYWLDHHHGILTVAPHWPGAVLAPVTGGRAPAHWWGLTCAVVSGPACPPAQG